MKKEMIKRLYWKSCFLISTLIVAACGNAVKKDGQDSLARKEPGEVVSDQKPVVESSDSNSTTPSSSTMPKNSSNNELLLAQFEEQKVLCVACHTVDSGTSWKGAETLEGWKKDIVNIESRVQISSMPPSPLKAEPKKKLTDFIAAVKAEVELEKANPPPVVVNPPPVVVNPPPMNPPPVVVNPPPMNPPPVVVNPPPASNKLTFAEAKALCSSCHANASWNKTEAGWKGNKAKILSEVNTGKMPKGTVLAADKKTKLINYINSL